MSSARTYKSEQIEHILESYRHLFREDEIAPGLSTYWDFNRSRPWSDITTNFHAATCDRLFELHSLSLEIEKRNLAAFEKGESLRAAARELGVGFSAGVCPWTDNLLLNTFDPRKPKKDLVLIIGHDWYPIGTGALPESALYDQGLHHTERYRRWCPDSFFRMIPNEPVIFFMNLYPDFRPPGAAKTGPLPRGSYPYGACVDGLREVLRILGPKFERISVISWGKPAWEALSPLVDGEPIRRSIKVQQKEYTGSILSIGGTPYLPMAHPAFGSNHSKEHLRSGYRQLRLGVPEFDLPAAR